MAYNHGIKSVFDDNSLRPISDVDTSLQAYIGTADGADADAFPLNKPVLVKASDTELIASLGTDGNLKHSIAAAMEQVAGMVVVIRVAFDAIQADQISNYVGDSLLLTGVHALKKCANILQLEPRVVCVPGITSVFDGNNMNAVVAALGPVLLEIDAIGIIDGPNQTLDAPALAHAAMINNKNMFMVEGYVNVWDIIANDYVARPASPYVAGAVAYTDKETDLVEWADNKPVRGISSTVKHILKGVQGNALNEAGVAFISHENGFRVWGARTLSQDPKWLFMQEVRIAIAIKLAVARSTQWVIGKNMGTAALPQLRQAIIGYFTALELKNWIPPGWTIEVLPEDNPLNDIMQGKITVRITYTPWGPIESVKYLYISAPELKNAVFDRL